MEIVTNRVKLRVDGRDADTMDCMKQERTYVAWMAGAVVSALALVGVVAAADVNKTPALQKVTQIVDIPAGAKVLAPGEKCPGRRIKTKTGTDLCLGGNVPFGLVPEDTVAVEVAPASLRFSPYITEPKPCEATSADLASA